MFQTFFPDNDMASAYEIPYEKLYERGIRALIVDIDNTLTEHGKPATERTIELMNRLRSIGFRVCLLSNNKEERVKMFNQDICVDYIYKAGKPSRSGYLRAMEKMGSNVKNTVFIGDQLFTDVWGAKRAGMESWLVDPIDKHEEIQIVLKRYLEKPILYFYRKEKRKNGTK